MIDIEHDTLPSVPSALIRTALAHLQSLATRPDFDINMDCWIGGDADPDGRPVCSVCLAGAAVVGQFKLDFDTLSDEAGTDGTDELGPQSFTRSIQAKMYALNNFRLGSVLAGLENLEPLNPAPAGEKTITEIWNESGLEATIKFNHWNSCHSDDPEAFDANLERIADALESLGL